MRVKLEDPNAGATATVAAPVRPVVTARPARGAMTVARKVIGAAPLALKAAGPGLRVVVAGPLADRDRISAGVNLASTARPPCRCPSLKSASARTTRASNRSLARSR